VSELTRYASAKAWSECPTRKSESKPSYQSTREDSSRRRIVGWPARTIFVPGRIVSRSSRAPKAGFTGTKQDCPAHPGRIAPRWLYVLGTSFVSGESMMLFGSHELPTRFGYMLGGVAVFGGMVCWSTWWRGGARSGRNRIVPVRRRCRRARLSEADYDLHLPELRLSVDGASEISPSRSRRANDPA
jgi:hypothetical protein